MAKIRRKPTTCMIPRLNSTKTLFNSACFISNCGFLYLFCTLVYLYNAGAVYLDRCQGQRIIPIWLIVFGCFSLLQTAINIIKRIFRKNKQREEEEGGQSNYANRTGSCLETLISFFLFIWIILGSYWVFGYYGMWSAEGCRSASNACYCHPVAYLFSFVTLIVIYVMGCIFCCLCCCLFVFLALASEGAAYI